MCNYGISNKTFSELLVRDIHSKFDAGRPHGQIKTVHECSSAKEGYRRQMKLS
jgi:hypothetical protein